MQRFEFTFTSGKTHDLRIRTQQRSRSWLDMPLCRLADRVPSRLRACCRRLKLRQFSAPLYRPVAEPRDKPRHYPRQRTWHHPEQRTYRPADFQARGCPGDG